MNVRWWSAEVTSILEKTSYCISSGAELNSDEIQSMISMIDLPCEHLDPPEKGNIQDPDSVGRRLIEIRDALNALWDKAGKDPDGYWSSMATAARSAYDFINGTPPEVFKDAVLDTYDL